MEHSILWIAVLGVVTWHFATISGPLTQGCLVPPNHAEARQILLLRSEGQHSVTFHYSETDQDQKTISFGPLPVSDDLQRHEPYSQFLPLSFEEAHLSSQVLHIRSLWYFCLSLLLSHFLLY